MCSNLCHEELIQKKLNTLEKNLLNYRQEKQKENFWQVRIKIEKMRCSIVSKRFLGLPALINLLHLYLTAERSEENLTLGLVGGETK